MSNKHDLETQSLKLSNNKGNFFQLFLYVMPPGLPLLLSHLLLVLFPQHYFQQYCLICCLNLVVGSHPPPESLFKGTRSGHLDLLKCPRVTRPNGFEFSGLIETRPSLPNVEKISIPILDMFANALRVNSSPYMPPISIC